MKFAKICQIHGHLFFPSAVFFANLLNWKMGSSFGHPIHDLWPIYMYNEDFFSRLNSEHEIALQTSAYCKYHNLLHRWNYLIPIGFLGVIPRITSLQTRINVGRTRWKLFGSLNSHSHAALPTASRKFFVRFRNFGHVFWANLFEYGILSAEPTLVSRMIE